jgi:putative membrane protein
VQVNPRFALAVGAAVLIFAWAGPLPMLVRASFSAHMLLHMMVVGVGVPLLAIGIVGLRPITGMPVWLTIGASLADFVVIWVWHAPLLHHSAASGIGILIFEQGSFAAAALLVWLVALSGPPVAGALALFFTSMHMTLLGALIALAPRAIYHAHAQDHFMFAPLEDQQIGGVIMLGIGGVIYFTGALWLAAISLRPGTTT